MKNLVFTLWVILFPVSVKLADYLTFLARGSVIEPEPKNAAWFIVTAVFLGTWVGVGYLLYEPRSIAAAETLGASIARPQSAV